MHEYDKMLRWIKEGRGNRTISIENLASAFS